MNLENILIKEIQDEAKKLGDRHHAYHNWLEGEIRRKNSRLVGYIEKTVSTPDFWDENRLFDPFYVHKHAKSIAHSINKKILNFTYRPNAPYKKEIDKPSGGKRTISVYQIPDAAISRMFFKYLIAKNRHRFSSFSYAYRNDKNAHFAIIDIYNDIKNFNRLFLAEYDFSKFFDNISHNFIYSELSLRGFFITKTEKFIIEQFLESYAQIPGKGIPQGLALSLFLANVSCWLLDRKLEEEGLRFARYADDTVVWARQYDKICRSFDIIHDFSQQSKVNINEKKSEGISLLISDHTKKHEIQKTKTFFEFLGYSISYENIGIKKASIQKIKKHVSYIIYSNLVQPLNNGKNNQHPINIFHDKDVCVCLQQIRRYIYGDLSEEAIRRYLFGGIHRISFKGVMSYYPIVTDINQLKLLDGWMANSIYLALKRRYSSLNITFECANKDKFIDFYATEPLYKIPSFVLIHQAIQKSIQNSGLNFKDSYNYWA